MSEEEVNRIAKLIGCSMGVLVLLGAGLIALLVVWLW